MAQAARLSLRMQKELKLLMADPPPGVSIPQLSDSDDLSPSSLTSLEARIDGPEGTVYSNGVFTLKIQIPERYPFQPPNATFITPIYHPNIDNGGRICLDILNLPPKGAWQPSLNISTVLTSIGLLLSEPNPDDGLMAETSREYKYNRQVFDQKAQSWTEKYANPHDTGRRNCDSFPAVIPSKELGIEAQKAEVFLENLTDDTEGSRKKLRLTGEKLSLKPKTQTEETSNDKENLPPGRKLSISRLQKPLPENSSVSVISKHAKMYCEPPRVENECLSEHEQHKEKPDDKVIDSLVVSDSEESDEGEKPPRSRLSLMRKLLIRRS